MKYRITTTKRFDKAFLLSHKLKGYKGKNVWECHIEPDWLLIWEQHDDELLLVMLSTGTHSDLFGKNKR